MPPRRCLLVLLSLLSITACTDKAPDTPDTEVPVLTVGHVGHDHQIALYIAAMKGPEFIEAWGVGLLPEREGEVYRLVEGSRTLATLRLLKVGGGSQMPAALSRGEIDIGLGGVPAVAKLADSQASRGVKIICPLQTDGDMLVLAADSPIANWPQFVAAAKAREKPFVIGYKAPLAVAMLIFRSALEAEGLTWSMTQTPEADVVLQNMRGGKNAIPLLSGQELDGFVMNQPVVAIAEHKGIGKTIADLRDLPPDGLWANHPCCCVCATGEVIATHPDVLTALLMTLHLGNAFIREHPQQAAEMAAAWIKTPPEVERASVPSIAYGTEPTDAWRAGMTTWLTLMMDEKLFTGRFADRSPEEIMAEVCQMRFCEQAAAQLREKGALPKQP